MTPGLPERPDGEDLATDVSVDAEHLDGRDIWARSIASAAPVETVNPNLESSWPVEM